MVENEHVCLYYKTGFRAMIIIDVNYNDNYNVIIL